MSVREDSKQSDVAHILKIRHRKIKKGKIAKGATGDPIKFMGELITNVSFKGKTLILKAYIMKNTGNLFGADWLEQSQLWDMPISSLCQKVENLTDEAEKLKGEL